MRGLETRNLCFDSRKHLQFQKSLFRINNRREDSAESRLKISKIWEEPEKKGLHRFTGAQGTVTSKSVLVRCIMEPNEQNPLEIYI